MGEERELYEIRHQLECILDVLQRLAMAAEKLVPRGSEREQIALRIYSANTVGADAAFEYADEWLAERDKQRGQQAE